MRRADRIALAALAGAVASVVAMPWLLGLDEVVYRWLQFRRTCATPAAADAAQVAVMVALGALVAIAALGRGRERPSDLAASVACVATGAAVGEILKTMLERLRPRALPITSGANSFPSGHIMNTTLVALAAWLLVRRSHAPRWMKALAAALAIASVCVQIIARVGRGSHWITDVPGSVLLAIAWTLGAGALARLAVPTRAVAALLAAALFALTYHVPTARLRLPSALDDPALRAAAPTGEDDPALRADGAAPPEQRLIVPGAPGATALKIALQARCTEHPRECCASVTARVNEWTASPLTISSAWHELHLAPPPGVLRDGPNVVALTIDGARCGGGPGCVGIGVGFARIPPG
ncbi:MAG TPA: phosphatase PAP2 family protein [Candidatus Binatia bacterium]|jgi:undecaprenyl-diphosphatase